VQAQPRFVPDTDIKKVGEVEFNVAKRFSLGFTNKGDKPLLVKKAKASCGCIDVATPKSPIAPGARGEITLTFDAKLLGNAPCSGHTECDSIIMDQGRILAVPGLEANHVDAALVHEAAIGKIAGDQIIKLMTLGLTEQEAEEQIINGFLK
jgi:hypothetical protein